MEPVLIATGLRKTFRLSYRQRRTRRADDRRIVAVDRLSFTAYRGEVFGLLGSNGAGKTTTLRMIATLIRPDEGDVTVDGLSVTRNPAAVRARIGFLTSDLRLEEFFTPDYLFDFFSALRGVPPDAAAARKAELFDRFGIGAFSSVRVANLSSGMRQKVSLVVSVVHDPDVIIFDEPTNGLDAITARAVTDFLADQAARGRTIVLSTHIFSLAERLCDRVGILVDGRMAVCDALSAVRGDLSLEDRFLELYRARAGREA